MTSTKLAPEVRVGRRDVQEVDHAAVVDKGSPSREGEEVMTREENCHGLGVCMLCGRQHRPRWAGGGEGGMASTGPRDIQSGQPRGGGEGAERVHPFSQA